MSHCAGTPRASATAGRPRRIRPGFRFWCTEVQGVSRGGQRWRSCSFYRAGVMVTFSIWLDAGYR
ncbi:uncharacterized protein SOCEGT47_043090 [Sorangium cellulosum]|uniref:Uncharacterized protein n=1 Tax=Sorangium cellulosum TaxID=56 RepID=A0A4P2Q3B5_SORCE|nr:uncharacterized protein SOCEGT47_043090 [Sorangium cellulosum]